MDLSMLRIKAQLKGIQRTHLACLLDLILCLLVHEYTTCQDFNVYVSLWRQGKCGVRKNL